MELLENESNRNINSIKLALEHCLQTLLPSPPPKEGSWVSVWRGTWEYYILRGKTYFGVNISIFNQARILLFAEYKRVPSLTNLGTIAVARKVKTNKIIFKLELELEIPRTLAIEVEKCIDWIQDKNRIV